MRKGGGICGISTAYFLSKRGIKCLVVEKTGIGKSASGKAGGFLAKDWVDNPALLELYSDAFRLHKTLAQELQLTSYRSIQTLQVDANSSLFNNEEATANKSSSWLRSYLSMKLLDAETAQVIPMELLQRLSDEAVQMGARLIVDTVDDLEYNRDIAFSDDMRFVEGVYTRTHGLIHGKKVLLALGPWTGTVTSHNLSETTLIATIL